MEQTFAQFLDRLAILNEEEKSLIEGKFVAEDVPAKYALVSLNQPTDTLYFVLRGYVRKYCFKDGNPYTLQLIAPYQFAVEYIGFMTGERSENILETVEPCQLLAIKKHDLEGLYRQVPVMNTVMRKVLEKVILKTHQLLNDFIRLSPEERYLKLLQNDPALFDRLPQYVIASYLGISATSLSRIRKRVSQR